MKNQNLESNVVKNVYRSYQCCNKQTHIFRQDYQSISISDIMQAELIDVTVKFEAYVVNVSMLGAFDLYRNV